MPGAAGSLLFAEAQATAGEIVWAFFTSFAAMSAAEWAQFGIVAAALVGGIGWLVTFRSAWRGDADPTAANSEMLVSLREMTRRGEISEEEYRSVRSQVAGETSGGIRGTTPAAD